MRQFRNKRRIQKMVYSKLTIVILIVLLFLVIKGSWGVYSKSQASITRENLSAVELSRLEDRKEKLEEDIEKLDSRVGIEEQLRLRYSLSKEGERVIIIIDEEEEKEETIEENRGLINSLFRKLNLVE